MNLEEFMLDLTENVFRSVSFTENKKVTVVDRCKVRGLILTNFYYFSVFSAVIFSPLMH